MEPVEVTIAGRLSVKHQLILFQEATSTSKKELSELVDAVDRLINEISNNFSSKTRDIVDKRKINFHTHSSGRRLAS